MKADSCSRISKPLFYVMMAVTLVIIGLFFFVGFGETETLNGNELLAPMFTDALLYWIYVLTGLAVVLVFVFGIVSFAKKLKDSPKEAMKSLMGVVVLLVLFVVAYLLSSDEAIVVNGKPLVDGDTNPIAASSYVLTDVLLYVQYVLFGACTLATIFGLLNISKSVKK